MKKSLMSNKLWFAILTFALLGCAWEMFTTANLDKVKTSALQASCEAINADITRPDGRRCIKPLEFKGNVFKFKTLNGRIESYEVLTVKLNDGTEQAYYTFKSYSNE